MLYVVLVLGTSYLAPKLSVGKTSRFSIGSYSIYTLAKSNTYRRNTSPLRPTNAAAAASFSSPRLLADGDGR